MQGKQMMKATNMKQISHWYFSSKLSLLGIRIVQGLSLSGSMLSTYLAARTKQIISTPVPSGQKTQNMLYLRCPRNPCCASLKVQNAQRNGSVTDQLMRTIQISACQPSHVSASDAFGRTGNTRNTVKSFAIICKKGPITPFLVQPTIANIISKTPKACATYTVSRSQEPSAYESPNSCQVLALQAASRVRTSTAVQTAIAKRLQAVTMILLSIFVNIYLM